MDCSLTWKLQYLQGRMGDLRGPVQDLLLGDAQVGGQSESRQDR